MTVLTLNVEPLAITEEQFYELCRTNRDLRLERTAAGEVIIMPPAGSETGACNGSISAQLWLWNERSGLGLTFDSSTGFKLPNGATRSPDAAWIMQVRWNVLTAYQKRGFAPLCPDFVLELCSPSDEIEVVRAKMREYIANGARLGWLLDPQTRMAEIYEPGEAVETLYNPTSLSGDPVLPGFVLDLSRVFM